MTTNQHTPPLDGTAEPAHRRYLVDYAAVLVRWRKLIVVNFIVVTLAAVIVSLLLPKWYKATTSLLPPKE